MLENFECLCGLRGARGGCVAATDVVSVFEYCGRAYPASFR